MNEKVNNLRHLERIAQAMTPDPSKWSFEGEVLDLGDMVGHCSCGHPIRYEFIVRHPDGRTAPIGSTCIETSVPWLIKMGAKELASQLQDALENHEEAKREAMRQLRDSKNAEQVQHLKIYWNEVIDPWYKQTKQEWKSQRSGRYIWYPNWLYKGLPEIKEGSTPGRTANSYRSKIATMARDAFEAEIQFPNVTDEKVYERIDKKLDTLISNLQNKVDMYHRLSCQYNKSGNSYYDTQLARFVEELEQMKRKIKEFKEEL